jgi:hypothetical protein
MLVLKFSRRINGFGNVRLVPEHFGYENIGRFSGQVMVEYFGNNITHQRAKTL